MTEMRHQAGSGTPQGTPEDQNAPLKEAPAGTIPPGGRAAASPWRGIAIGAASVLLIAVLAAVGYGLVSHPPFTAVLRDISIIVLAFATLVTCIFLAILLLQLQSLIVLLRDELQPLLKSISETAGTVRGTTTFVSDAVVTPMIAVASYASAVRATVRSLFGGSSRPPDLPRSPNQPH